MNGCLGGKTIIIAKLNGFFFFAHSISFPLETDKLVTRFSEAGGWEWGKLKSLHKEGRNNPLLKVSNVLY